MIDPTQTAAGVEERLRGLGTPKRAEGEKRYLRSRLEHLGATVPQVRSEAKRVGKGLTARGDLVAVVEALWAEPVHERRSCAAYLLKARVDLLDPADVALIERLVREAQTWALVDVLAVDVLGDLILRFPDAVKLDAWACDGDLWIRRSALLAQIRPLKAGFDFAPFGRYADTMLDEEEFFIRKAIGWVLREAGRSRPDEVYAWLLPRIERASGVTFREAVKHLSPQQQTALARRR